MLDEHASLVPPTKDEHTERPDQKESNDPSQWSSEGTVRNYLTAAIRKLDARNRMEALRIAEEKGWL